VENDDVLALTFQQAGACGCGRGCGGVGWGVRVWGMQRPPPATLTSQRATDAHRGVYVGCARAAHRGCARGGLRWVRRLAGGGKPGAAHSCAKGGKRNRAPIERLHARMRADGAWEAIEITTVGSEAAADARPQ
jgi:hypothetical protein